MMEPTCSAFYYRCVCVCKTCGFHNHKILFLILYAKIMPRFLSCAFCGYKIPNSAKNRSITCNRCPFTVNLETNSCLKK
jgi:hypothetical protein